MALQLIWGFSCFDEQTPPVHGIIPQPDAFFYHPGTAGDFTQILVHLDSVDFGYFPGWPYP